MIDELALRVLRAVHAGMESAVGLSVALNESPDRIRTSLDNLLALGLVESAPDRETGLRVTEAAAGLLASGGPQVTTGTFGSTSVTSVRFSFGRQPVSPAEEWADVGRLVSHAWSAAQSSRTAEQRKREGQLLVGDEDRDAALHELAVAYGEGRLTQEEHDRRTDAALRARTRADLDAVCFDLSVGEPAGQRATSGRRTVSLAVTLVSIPLLLFALLLIGDGDSARGMGLLAVLVPSLLALWLWAHRHRPHR